MHLAGGRNGQCFRPRASSSPIAGPRRDADPSHKLVREVVGEVPSRDPAAVLKGVGEPKRGEVQKLYHSDTLTILNVIWAPSMTIMPHDHRMWAVIGVYTGREDNIFWRRVPGAKGGKLEAAGARAPERRGCRAARAQHHPFGDEPDPPPDGRHPRLRRRFLRGASGANGTPKACWRSPTTSNAPCGCSRRPTGNIERARAWKGVPTSALRALAERCRPCALVALQAKPLARGAVLDYRGT